jgi:hypothetical protein
VYVRMVIAVQRYAAPAAHSISSTKRRQLIRPLLPNVHRLHTLQGHPVTFTDMWVTHHPAPSISRRNNLATRRRSGIEGSPWKGPRAVALCSALVFFLLLTHPSPPKPSRRNKQETGKKPPAARSRCAPRIFVARSRIARRRTIRFESAALHGCGDWARQFPRPLRARRSWEGHATCRLLLPRRLGPRGSDQGVVR